LLTASRAKTLEGVSGIMNLVMMPMWIFSGVFFSYSRFPDAIQPFIKLLPLTPLLDGLRSIMIDGAPLSASLGQVLAVAAWGLVSFAIALKIFRWS
jgi:ABC-2 type transport system permease protein